MTSKLVMERLAAAGLTDLLELRERGERPGITWREQLARVDTLLLGAAANITRRRELGDEAAIFVPLPPPDDGLAEVIRPLAGGEGGTALLRRIATLRLCSSVGLSIVVDWTELGLETAQLGLSFGASGLTGPVASRRGLPMADGGGARGLAKRREIAAYVARAGYVPRFINTSSAPASDLERSQPAPENPRNAHVGS